MLKLSYVHLQFLHTFPAFIYELDRDRQTKTKTQADSHAYMIEGKTDIARQWFLETDRHNLFVFAAIFNSHLKTRFGFILVISRE